MSVVIKSSMIEYLATTHTINAILDLYRESVSRIEYYVNLIM
ncbi:MAG: hypothetical protein K0R09_1406 [Clostridiales bacterium]|jgi:hypothetical protein|nr:hypothetical protein [Clostridiales bacterium]